MPPIYFLTPKYKTPTSSYETHPNDLHSDNYRPFEAVRQQSWANFKPSYKDVSRISVLPFPASLNKSNGTQQLTRSVRSAMTYIHMRCDDRCQEGVRVPTWVPGWIHPLRLAFNRAITSDRPTTARMTTLIDDFFGQVSRALGGGTSGPEAFTLLLRLLVMHFDRVDTGEGCTKLHHFGVCNG